MPEFEPKPELLLSSREETLSAINEPSWFSKPGMFKYRVKSQWLCDRLDEYEKTKGFAYNAEFQRWIEEKAGIGPFDTSGSPLSVLVYNAQKYRDSDALIAQGFEPGSQEHLEKAFASGVKIELYHDSILGGSSVPTLTVKSIGGKLYAMLPRKRKFAVNIIGKPVRLAGTGPKSLDLALEHKGLLCIRD